MTRFPSLTGWHHALRVAAGVLVLVVSQEATLTAQSPPTAPKPAPGAPEVKQPTTRPGDEMTHQLLLGAGAASSGPGGPRVTMRVEYAPYGRQALLIGMSAEEQVGSAAAMLMNMPASHRFGAN